MKNTATALLSLMLFFLTSCDKPTSLTYKVKNMAYDHIQVICVNGLGSTPSDTFLISYNEVKTIAINLKGLDKVHKYKESGSQLQDFKKMDIYKYDTARANPTQTNFLQTKLWSYAERGSHAADYTATVTTNDF